MATHCVLRIGIVFTALLLLLGHATAHLDLGPDELVEYHSNIKRDSKTLSSCLRSPEMRDHSFRVLSHRDQALHYLRKARDLSKRSYASAKKWNAINHESKPGHTRDPQYLFNFRWNEDPTYNSTGCALTPFSNYGPYWHEGQPQRQDIRAGQKGIYLRLSLQIIDISRCKPLHGAQVDVWQATTMGDYSPKADGYLRGWQPTSRHGTVDSDTNFPGHYKDRASHIHVVVRALHEKRVVNFGQIYFDQKLRDEVEATTQYKNNQKPFCDNAQDDFIPYDSSDKADPFVRWSRIGDSLEDGGLLAWITLGVNTTNIRMPQPPNQKRDVIDWHLDYSLPEGVLFATCIIQVEKNVRVESGHGDLAELEHAN